MSKSIGKSTIYVDGKQVGECRDVSISFDGPKVNEPMDLPREVVLVGEIESVELGPGYWQVMCEFGCLGPMIGDGI